MIQLFFAILSQMAWFIKVFWNVVLQLLDLSYSETDGDTVTTDLSI